MSFFGVDIPNSVQITVKIRLITGRGKPFTAWEGCADANEADVLETMCKSPMVCAFIKRATENQRLKPDEDGAYRVHAKVLCYESGQLIQEGPTELVLYMLHRDELESSSDQMASLEVIRTLVDSLAQREDHMRRMVEQLGRLHDSYEKTVSTISQHSLQTMDKVSNHAASAFSAAAAPFADMSKSLVKALDDSRSNSATNAKESQDLLIEALRNRILETNQVTKQSVTQDIKEVLQLWPMFKGLLGEELKPQP